MLINGAPIARNKHCIKVVVLKIVLVFFFFIKASSRPSSSVGILEIPIAFIKIKRLEQTGVCVNRSYVPTGVQALGRRRRSHHGAYGK